MIFLKKNLFNVFVLRLSFLAPYLEGAQPQFDVKSGRHSGVLWQEGKHCVVHPEQRDEKQGGFSQPPEGWRFGGGAQKTDE